MANYRNQKLLEELRNAPFCMACNLPNDGTICAAHSNQLAHGKGRSLKAHDCFVAALCHRCHYLLDQGPGMSKEERREFWNSAYFNTMLWLWMSGAITLK